MAGENDPDDRLKIMKIPLDMLRPKVLVRRDLGDLKPLAISLKEDGFQNLIIASRSSGGGYEIICGLRRYEAAKLAGLDVVPVRVIEPVDYSKALELIWKENELRKDFTLEELALLLSALVKFLGVRKTAERLGLPKSTVDTMARAGKVLRATHKYVRTSDVKGLKLKVKLAEAVERAVSKAGYEGEEYWEMIGKVYLMLSKLPTSAGLRVLSEWSKNPTIENLGRLIRKAERGRSPPFRPRRIDQRVPVEIQGDTSLEELLLECGYDWDAAYRETEEISLRLVSFRGRYGDV